MNALFKPVAENAGPGTSGGKTASVVCAVLMPHAPIIVPVVGGERGGAAAASCRAMREAARKIVSFQPETLVLVSPHSPRRSGVFGLWSDEPIEGSFAQFGASQVWISLPNERRLANAIAAEARSRNVETWRITRHVLDHGALVPLWFLAEAGWTGPTVLLSLNCPGEGGLASLGEAIAAAANKLQQRIAFIASGDMSHRLTANAPGGFHRLAHRFDETFISLVRAGEYRQIMGINSELRELAAEDVVDSTIVAAAAVGWNAAGHKVINYEGPFGVGYGVAILFAVDSISDEAPPSSPVATAHPGEILSGVARQSVKAALLGSAESPAMASDGYLTAPHGVFVTIHHGNGKLRGCVGTLSPMCANVVAETWRNARLAAFQDMRFSPVTMDELAELRFEVSVVHSVAEVSSADDLDPRHCGVIVSTADGRRGVLLPGIQAVKTAAQQLQLARQKGGIDQDEPFKLECFQVDHFEETI